MTNNSEYTPTTEEARVTYIHGTPTYCGVTRARTEFDRWLAEHDREVAKRAWDEGYGDDSEAHVPRANPYRSSEGEKP